MLKRKVLYHNFNKNIMQNISFLSSKSAYYNNSLINDTEDWSNDAENSPLRYRNK